MAALTLGAPSWAAAAKTAQVKAWPSAVQANASRSNQVLSGYTGLVADDLGVGALGTPSPQDASVTEFNPATLQIGPSIQVTSPPSSLPEALVVARDGTTVYATGSSAFWVMNLAQRTVTSSISLGAHTSFLTLSPNGKMAYATGSGTITPIDVAATPPRPLPIITINSNTSDTDIMVFSPDGKTAWVSDPYAGVVYPFNPATNKVGKAIPTGAGADGLAVSRNGKTLWVANGSFPGLPNPADTITELAISGSGATARATKVKDIPVATGIPTLVAMAPNGRRLYVALFAQSEVTWVNTATGTLAASPPLKTGGLAADQMAFSPNGKTLYVAGGNYSAQSSDLAVISVAGTPRVTGVINGLLDPTDVAITPRAFFGGRGTKGTGSGRSAAGGSPGSAKPESVNGFTVPNSNGPYGSAERQMLGQVQSKAVVVASGTPVCTLSAAAAKPVQHGTGLLIIWTIAPTKQFVHASIAKRRAWSQRVEQLLSTLQRTSRLLYLKALSADRVPLQGGADLAKWWGVEVRSISTTGSLQTFQLDTKAGGATTTSWGGVFGVKPTTPAQDALANLLYYTKALAVL